MVVNRSAIVALRKSVSAFFADRGVTANVFLGWKDRTRQDNQGPDGANRVVFVVDADAGKLAPPHGPGARFDPSSNPGDHSRPTSSRRALANWEQALNVSVWAVDPSSPTDEEAQIEATDTLFEWTIRAVHNFDMTQAIWGSVKRSVVSPNERTFGLEILAQLTMKHPMLDEQQDIVYPTTEVVKRVNT